MTGKVLTPAEVAAIRNRWWEAGICKRTNDVCVSHEALRADNARLRGLIEGMECQSSCAKYDYFGVSCEKCGVGEVHARGPLCPEDGKPHSWITVAQKPCNCVKSKVDL